MYTLRTKTNNVSMWAIDADKFVLHVTSYNREEKFKIFQKQRDLDLINQLARNVYNATRGINTDGCHEKTQKLHDKQDRREKKLSQHEVPVRVKINYRPPAQKPEFSIKVVAKSVELMKEDIRGSKSTTSLPVKETQCSKRKNQGKRAAEDVDVNVSRLENVESRPAVNLKANVDMTNKMLSFNPGNKVRQKAITVDLGDFEQLRHELNGTDKEKLDGLYGAGRSMNIQKKRSLKNQERLKTMTM